MRVWHWTNALAAALALLTGLLIFNTHPTLYWGEDGHVGSPFIASLVAGDEPGAPHFSLHVGAHHWDVTRFMGVVELDATDRYVLVGAYPKDFQFGATRVWHFMAAWILSTAWLTYGVYLIVSGRLAHFLWPTRADRTWRTLIHELKQHVLLRRARGEAASRYNVLQKASYLVVLFLFIPALILSGLTMSNSVTAAVPDLFLVFGGRQSARSIHFIAAALLTGFVLIHVLQAIVAGRHTAQRAIRA